MAYEKLEWHDINKEASLKVAKAVEEYAIAYSSAKKAVEKLRSVYAEHLGVTSLMIGWKNGPDRLSYALTSKSTPIEKVVKPTKPVKATPDTVALMEKIALLERALSLKAQAFEEPEEDDEDDEDGEPEPVKPVRRRKR